MNAAQKNKVPTAGVQRIENGALAAMLVVVVIALGQPWWMLLVAFLVFDLSALGYLAGKHTGAFTYNLVHNYTAPALIGLGYAVLAIAGIDAGWLALVAACWAFHVAVDRALGYGLKLEDFSQTHLGRIGKAAAAARAPG
ncbi:MAG: DUF4260 domain-containing protein [Gulosibacter sp.]|uniref:DUF4260 domain-containing protein n=1 Tax=Gulosibacter sp. TaxID=2817531 RepID=UPI003F93E1BF